MFKISYDADGATTEFLFAFPFFQAADIHVACNDVEVPATTFSVAPNDDFDGGNVIFNTAPAAGTRVDIFRRVALSRVIDYQPTAKIDPEDLNADFNFLLEAFRDLHSVDVDLAEWANRHDSIKQLMEYTNNLITDKLSGGGVLGIYNNLVSVLAGAAPALINDYGLITEPAPNETRDDYGLL